MKRRSGGREEWCEGKGREGKEMKGRRGAVGGEGWDGTPLINFFNRFLLEGIYIISNLCW